MSNYMEWGLGSHEVRDRKTTWEMHAPLWQGPILGYLKSSIHSTETLAPNPTTR